MEERGEREEVSQTIHKSQPSLQMQYCFTAKIPFSTETFGDGY